MPTVCETYSRAKGIHHLQKGRIVICAAGTGLPFFTTDTGAALRAAELRCQALLKGTSVDGVYSADPKTSPAAKRFDRITFGEILKLDLRIMDPAEVSFPFTGDLELVGMETTLSRKIGNGAAFRNAALDALDAHQRALGASAQRYGFSFHTYLTDQTASAVLFSLMHALAQRDGGAMARTHG